MPLSATAGVLRTLAPRPPPVNPFTSHTPRALCPSFPFLYHSLPYLLFLCAHDLDSLYGAGRPEAQCSPFLRPSRHMGPSTSQEAVWHGARSTGSKSVLTLVSLPPLTQKTTKKITLGIQTSAFPPGRREAYHPMVDNWHFSCPTGRSGWVPCPLVSQLGRGPKWANQSPPPDSLTWE